MTLCAGCGRRLVDGELCIKGKPGEFLGMDANPVIDDLVAEILSGGEKTDTLVYCEACIEHGGPFSVEVYHEREEA